MTAGRTLTGIARALRGEVNSGGYVLAPGPGHSPRDRSMQVRIDDGGIIRVHSYAADPWQVCRDYVLRILGEPDWRDRDRADPVPWSPPAPRVETPDDRAKADRDARSIAATLAGCRSLPGTIAETYLRWRGCPMPPADDVLLFHPGIRHLSGATVPALVARITSALDASRLIGLHFVALTETGEGKSELAPRKWTRGAMKGGVVRLCPDDEVTLGLGVGEGVETCLSVVCGGWRPVWACLSAGNIAALPPLPPLCLTIFADPGEAGMRGARAALAAWTAAGLEATIAAPPDNYSDWNDGGDHAQG